MGLRGAKKEAALVAVAEVENEILDDQRPRDLPFAIFEMLGDIAHELRKLNAEEESSAITQPITLQLTAGTAETKTLHPGQLIKYIAIYSTPVAINIATGADLGKLIATIPAGWQGVITCPPSKDISFSWAAPAATGIVIGLVSSHRIGVDKYQGGTGGALTDRSGSIAAGGTAQVAAPANPRRYLLLQNPTTGTESFWVTFDGTPAVIGSPSIEVAKGVTLTFESSYIPQGAISVIAATLGTKYTILAA